MLLKLIHIGFGYAIASLIVAAMLIAMNGQGIAEIVTVVVVMTFTWVSIWRSITDARKDDLLDKVDAIADDNAEQTIPLDGLASGQANPQSDQIQAGMPKRKEDIQRL